MSPDVRWYGPSLLISFTAMNLRVYNADFTPMWLTSWSRILLRKVTVTLLIKKFTSFYRTKWFNYLSATLHDLFPQNKIWILTFNRTPCSYFSQKCFKPFMVLRSIGIQHLWSHVDCYNFCIRLRISNVRHFWFVKGVAIGIQLGMWVTS
jgi:hypothetical protein